MFEIVGGIIVLTIMVLVSGIKVVRDYDQLVVFRFGKARLALGAGVHLIVPVVDRCMVVDTRLVTLPIDMIEELSADEVTVRVSAVCMYRIADARRTVTRLQNVNRTMAEFVETNLRSVINQHDLKHLMGDRARVSGVLKSRLDRQAKEWGVQIKSVELKQIKLPREMKKLLAQARRQQIDHHPGPLARKFADHFEPVAGYLS